MDFKISITTNRASEAIIWPILRRTSGAIQVETPGGAIWLPNQVAPSSNLSCHPTGVAHLLQILAMHTASRRDDLIPVKKSGPGPTEKSHKYSFDIVLHIEPRHEIPQTQAKTKTLTLPKSQIVVIDGKSYAPAWLLLNKLQRDRSQTVWESLPPRPPWPGLSAVREQIEAAAERVKVADQRVKDAKKQQKECEARRTVELAVQKAQEKVDRQSRLDELAGKVADGGEAALRFARETYALADLQRRGIKAEEWPVWPIATSDLTSLEFLAGLLDLAAGPAKNRPKAAETTLKDVSVNWAEWWKVKGKMEREDFSENGCLVKFFGKKRVIVLPDNSEITKMMGANLNISSTPNGESII